MGTSEPDASFAWGRVRGTADDLRKELYGALAFTAVPALFAFAHWVALVMALVGMAPVLFVLLKDVCSDARGICRIEVEQRRITLHRVNGRVVVRSLDDVRELQPLLVGYTGGETNGVRVLDIRIGRRNYRTDAHHCADDTTVNDLTEALRRACPTARVQRLEDKRYRLTPD
ncbi:hypothetical protein SUDANB95_02253 [Actinosynnema sp. ALI-1.44]